MAEFPPLPEEQYQVILADPPWQYQNWTDKKNGAAISWYETLTVEEICELPVQTLASANCSLLLWGTFPKLKEALQVMEAWGFEYKTVAFDWTKTYREPMVLPRYEFPEELVPRFGGMKSAIVIPCNGKEYCGLGFYTRGGNEICLLGTRGSPKRKSANVRGQIFARRRKHSQKPDVQYLRIEELFEGPYLELFARETHSGWDAWGTEVPNGR